MTERTKPPLAMNYSRTMGQLVIRRDGCTDEEAKALSACMHDSGFLFFLNKQGYDINTLRFSVRKKKVAP